MATFDEMQTLLGFRSLGAVYEERGRRTNPNAFFEYYIGGPTVAATEEVNQLLDEGATPQEIPLESAAGGGSVERFDTDTVEFLYLSNNKEGGRLNHRNSPAHIVQPTGADGRKVTLSHIFNQMKLSPGSMEMLREPDSWQLQRRGMKELSKQIGDFASKHMMTKQIFFKQMMTLGAVYLTEDLKILESSSGAVVTVNGGVPSGHKSRLNYDGNGNLIATAWDDAAAKILTQLDDISVAAEAENAPQPKHVWVNGKNKKWFRENTELKAFYSGIEKLNMALEGNTFELEGYIFHFDSRTYTDYAGNVQPFIPYTMAIITPDVGDWLFNAIGKKLVPSTMDVYGSAEEAFNSFTDVYGQFAYATIDHNPPSVDVFAGDTFMYAFREPKAVWLATVDF